MRLRRWGAAAAALVVAGCGSTVAGQASPAVISSPVTSPTGATTTSREAAVSSADLSVATMPSATAIAPGTPTTGSVPTASTSRTTTPRSTTPRSTTEAPSTTVKWLLPLPKAGAPKLNKFGNVIAAPGQPYAIEWNSNKQIAVVFVVDSIQVDRGCEVPVKARNGHLVVITVRAQLGYSTGKELSENAIGFTDSFWTAFDAKDTAEVDVDSPAAQACVTYKSQVPFATDLEPDEVYTGKIALDVSSATGSAVLMSSLDGGWLYRYG